MRLYRRLFFLLVLVITATASGQVQVLFYDSFEAPPEGVGTSNWIGWEDLSWVGPHAGCSDLYDNCFGPYMLDTGHPDDIGIATDGVRSAKATRAQPHWYAAEHAEPYLADALDEIVHLKGNQFETFFKTEPFPEGDPEFNVHDQVHGWIMLMNEDESEWFALGVHAHKWSPEPMLDRWTYMSWGTALDGWNVTSVHRAQSEWRALEIVVKPYSGQVGDIEFYIDGQLVGEGRRQPGDDYRGVAVTRIGIGANPKQIPEDYIANSYETYYYDEIELSVEPAGMPCVNEALRFDSDNDGDVDQEDFAVFQACHTGAGGAFDSGTCRCMNANEDDAIDEDDLTAFEACASGPGVLANPGCDDVLSYP